MKKFKKWLDQAICNIHKNKYKKENNNKKIKSKKKLPLPEGLMLTTYIVIIDTIHGFIRNLLVTYFYLGFQSFFNISKA